MCLCVSETYWTNPQFHVDITADDVDSEGRATVIIGLRQQPAPKPKKHEHQRVSLGYDLYQVSCWLLIWYPVSALGAVEYAQYTSWLDDIQPVFSFIAFIFLHSSFYRTTQLC